MKDPTKVLLADDHAMFREVVAEMLSTDEGIEIVGEANDGVEAVALVREKKPDVIVLDVEMPVMGAQATMRRLSRLRPQPKVVIVTMFAEPRLVRELLNLGASAYLLKSAPLKELLSTVHAVARGPHKNKAVLSLPQEVLDQVDGGPERKLSDRELEVLSLVARGMNNGQVAAALNLVEGTVKRHLHNVYDKLEVGSRSEAVRKALSEGWISARDLCLYVSPTYISHTTTLNIMTHGPRRATPKS